MPCTEEQFNRDLKQFLVDAGVDIKCCNAFEKNPYIQNPYAGGYVIGCFIFDNNYKTIDYNPKEFLKHLGIEIYDVGDVVNIGEYECQIRIHNAQYFLFNKKISNHMTYKQFSLKKEDLKNSIQELDYPDYFYATLYDLNKTIQFLKSHENKMQEKPFTIEQAKGMLSIEILKELVFEHYPELKSPVNTINKQLLSQLSYGMFGKIGVMVVAESAAKNINRPNLYGKSLLVSCEYDVFLHKTNLGSTIIEFKNK